MVREGKEFKAPRYASAAALYNDYVIICNIIPNNYTLAKTVFKVL